MSRDASAMSMLLLPHDVAVSLGNGGAELVVERDAATGEVRRCHVHILDEDERRDALRQLQQQQQQQQEHDANNDKNDDDGSKDDEELNTAATLVALHERYLQELQWARAALWSDERLRPYLVSASPQLWPRVEALSRVVDVVRQLKMCVDVPADVRGAERLSRAVALLQRETRYAGVHALKPAPVAGALTVYQSQSLRQHQQHGNNNNNNNTNNNNNNNNTQQQQHASKLQRHVAALRVAPAALLMGDVNTPPLTVSEVLRLSMTRHAQTTLVQLLVPSTRPPTAVDVTRRWRQLLQRHRTQLTRGARGLVCSVREATAMLLVSERALAAQMQQAAAAGRCVRLRSGVYATVVFADELYIVFDDGNDDDDNGSGSSSNSNSSAATAAVRADVATAFARVTRRTLAACLDDGRARVLVHTARGSNDGDDAVVARVLRDAFVSPALALCRDSDDDNDGDDDTMKRTRDDDANDDDGAAVVRRWCVVSPAQSLDAWARLVHVRVGRDSQRSDNDNDDEASVAVVHNGFVVLHGARVEGGFAGDDAVYTSLKRQRDEAAAEQTERALLQMTRNYNRSGTSRNADVNDDNNTGDAMDRGGSSVADNAHAALTSSTMTGEEVREGVARAVVSALATAPLTRAELLRHHAMRPWLREGDLDALLRTTLRAHADYRGRKYHLR